jgi:hypothetical protein
MVMARTRIQAGNLVGGRDWTGIGLWFAQGLLAALFLFAGGMKLVAPPEMLTGPVAFPVWFIRFIGAAEVLGAVGLILPEMLKVKRQLTPLAAAGLIVIMCGATVVNAIGGGAVAAIGPVIIGMLAAAIARGRLTRIAELKFRATRPSTNPAPLTAATA